MSDCPIWVQAIYYVGIVCIGYTVHDLWKFARSWRKS